MMTGMLGRFLTSLVAALLVTVVVPPRFAQACSQFRGKFLMRVFPANGAKDVPTNARVLVEYLMNLLWQDAGAPYAGQDLQLRDADGTPIPFDLSPVGPQTGFVLQPRQPHAPGAGDEIFDDGSACGASPCTASGQRRISAFVTGAGPDTSAPAFAGLGAVIMNRLGSCDNSSCCGPYVARKLTLEWQPATDVSPALLYNVYVNGA